MQITYTQVLTLYQNDTGPILQAAFLELDENTVVSLVGYGGWFSFWVPGAAPHIVRAAAVNGALGLVTYTPKGDEFASLGDLRYQATVMHPDYTENASTASGRGYFTLSGPVCRAVVVRKPT